MKVLQYEVKIPNNMLGNYHQNQSSLSWVVSIQ